MIYGLTEQKALDPARVGRKAANLARLAIAGFPVPCSRLLDTRFYIEFVSDPTVARSLETLLNTEMDIDAISDLFLQKPLPRLLLHSLDEISRAIVADSFAVRSSSTGEDSASASFAGIFSSFLDVQEVELEDAVRLVWASAHSYGVSAYCARLGISASSLKMGVIIQRFVPARAHGVLFTQGPTSNEICIDVGIHHQKKLETPSHYQLARSDFSVSRHIYGSAERSVLSKDDLNLLCCTAIEIEKSFGVPQDIEWVLDFDDTLYFLQSRPTAIHIVNRMK